MLEGQGAYSKDKPVRLDFRVGELLRLLRGNNFDPGEGVCFVVSVVEKKNFVHLSLPGGKRELGETSLDCGIRETMEEISLPLREFINGTKLAQGIVMDYGTCVIGDSTKFILFQATQR